MVEVVDIGIPTRGAGGGRDRPDRRRRAARDAAARLGLDEVLLRQRLHHRRLARADRRAVHVRAGRDARRGGLRDGRRARNRSSCRFTVRLLEAMMVGLPERDGSLATTALQPALEAIGRADAVVLGPGIGKEKGAQELARELVERIDVPLVIDADGLNALAGGAMEELAGTRRWPTVMTPARRRARADARGRLRRRSAAGACSHAREAAAKLEGDRRAQGRRHARRDARRPRRGLARLRARARDRRHRATCSPA